MFLLLMALPGTTGSDTLFIAWRWSSGDKIAFDHPCMRRVHDNFLYSYYPVRAGEEWALVDFSEEPGYCGRCLLIHCKKSAELRDGYPEPGTVTPLHIFFQTFWDGVTDGNCSHRSVQFCFFWLKFNDSADHARSGYVQLFRPRRIRSSRNRRISGQTCRYPCGLLLLHGVRGSHRMRRCVQCWLLRRICLAGSYWFFV
jgi:hypothetical protein